MLNNSLLDENLLHLCMKQPLSSVIKFQKKFHDLRLCLADSFGILSCILVVCSLYPRKVYHRCFDIPHRCFLCRPSPHPLKLRPGASRRSSKDTLQLSSGCTNSVDQMNIIFSVLYERGSGLIRLVYLDTENTDYTWTASRCCTATNALHCKDTLGKLCTERMPRQFTFDIARVVYCWTRAAAGTINNIPILLHTRLRAQSRVRGLS